MDDFTISLPQRSTWILRRVILYTAYPHCYHVIPNHLLTLPPVILYCYVLWSLISATLYSSLSFSIPHLHSPQASFLSALLSQFDLRNSHSLANNSAIICFSCEHFLPYWNQRSLLPYQPLLARRQVIILFPSCHILSHQCFNTIN